GRASCRLGQFPEQTYMYRPTRHLAKHLAEQNIASDTLHICLYSHDFRLSVDNMRMEAMYYRNGRPERLGDSLLPRGRLFIHNLPGLIRDLSGGRRTIILGHSYGGWVAMYAALNSRHRDGRMLFEPEILYTIDPISPLDCDIGAFLGSDPANNLSACRQFPSDLRP